jgi:hypothetical protein
MAENDDSLWISFARSGKCAFCKGKDGKAKEIYDTIQSAIDSAKFLEKERGVYLHPYKCPHGSGWHLTKNHADCELVERQEAIFMDNEIPVKSSRSADIAWEYIGPDAIAAEQGGEGAAPKKKVGKTLAPIVKIECESENQTIAIAGKITEIYKNINVEKHFDISFDHAFSAALAREYINKEIYQITAYVEKPETGQIASYTFFMEKSVMLKNKIALGCQANLVLQAKIINNRKAWHSDGRASANRL